MKLHHLFPFDLYFKLFFCIVPQFANSLINKTPVGSPHEIMKEEMSSIACLLAKRTIHYIQLITYILCVMLIICNLLFVSVT